MGPAKPVSIDSHPRHKRSEDHDLEIPGSELLGSFKVSISGPPSSTLLEKQIRPISPPDDAA